MNSDFLRLRLRRHANIVLAAAVLAIGTMSGADAAPATAPIPSFTAAIPMKKDGGVYVVPVSVNGLVTIECIVDSGASDVNIPADVFQKLVRAGTVQKSDFLGTQEYTLADGSTERGRTFRIKSLKVGNIVVNNVVASVGGDGSSALLGQSFLERFRSWSLDNSRHALVLLGPPSAGTPVAAGRPPVAADGPSSVSNGGGHADGPPDGTTIAQTPGGHTARNGQPPEPSDDRLTAQHSD